MAGAFARKDSLFPRVAKVADVNLKEKKCLERKLVRKKAEPFAPENNFKHPGSSGS